MAGTSTGGSPKRAPDWPECAEDVPPAEVQRKALLGGVDVVEIETGFDLVSDPNSSEGVENLVAARSARLWREPLSPHAGSPSTSSVGPPVSGRRHRRIVDRASPLF